MSSTVIIELHSWRGLRRDGGPLGAVLTIGWVSVCWIPFLLSDWIKSRLDAMKNALDTNKVPPRDTMAVWPDAPLHRVVKRGRT